MNRLVIIDGHAILHRAYHALPPSLTSSNGMPVNAVYGFTTMLLRLVEDLQPTHLAVTFDRPTPTFRKELYKEYQSHRPKMDDDLVPQIAATHQLLEAMNIAIFEMDGYEADDIIGTIAEKVKAQMECVIVTGDRDLLQLVDTQVKAYMPVKGLSDAKLFSEPEVVERLGIKPSQVIDYKALVGDPSDNYPGVAGIGPKTAIGLLEQFGTLEQIYAHLDEIKSTKVRLLLTEKKTDALLSQKLATVVRDVPLSLDLSSCILPPLDTPNVRQIFETFRFRSLITKIFKGSKIATEKQEQQLVIEEKKKEVEQTTLF